MFYGVLLLISKHKKTAFALPWVRKNLLPKYYSLATQKRLNKQFYVSTIIDPFGVGLQPISVDASKTIGQAICVCQYLLYFCYWTVLTYQSILPLLSTAHFMYDSAPSYQTKYELKELTVSHLRIAIATINREVGSVQVKLNDARTSEAQQPLIGLEHVAQLKETNSTIAQLLRRLTLLAAARKEVENVIKAYQRA